MFEVLEPIAASASQKEKFSKAANNLLNHCFILKKKADAKQDYFYIRDNKDAFRIFFDMLSYDIKIDEDIGLISIQNRNGTGRMQLTKFESIMFLIIRLLYLEKRSDLSADSDIVCITIQDIRDKYQVLKLKNRQKLDRNSEQHIISLFKRFNLIQNRSGDITKGETQIEIYPSVMFAVPNEGITYYYESVKEKLSQYESQTEEEDDDAESDEETE